MEVPFIVGFSIMTAPAFPMISGKFSSALSISSELSNSSMSKLFFSCEKGDSPSKLSDNSLDENDVSDIEERRSSIDSFGKEDGAVFIISGEDVV